MVPISTPGWWLGRLIMDNSLKLEIDTQGVSGLGRMEIHACINQAGMEVGGLLFRFDQSINRSITQFTYHITFRAISIRVMYTLMFIDLYQSYPYHGLPR